MAEEKEYLRIPGHVPVEEAAKLLKLRPSTVHQHIRAGHLPAKKVQGKYMISREVIEEFKRLPPGRLRTQPPLWKIYNPGIIMTGTYIHVQIYPGQQEAFNERLRKLHQEQVHLLTGSVQRDIFLDGYNPLLVHILMVWKENELPDKATHEQEWDAFCAEFAGVLDWENAKVNDLDGLLHT